MKNALVILIAPLQGKWNTSEIPRQLRFNIDFLDKRVKLKGGKFKSVCGDFVRWCENLQNDKVGFEVKIELED